MAVLAHLRILLLPLVLLPTAAVVPKLKPVEDKKFLRDYKDDKQPGANKYYAFGHPYPTVQDSGDYDKDYVKDENNDGGVWGAQMKYDELRGKVRGEEKKMNKFKRQADREKDDVEYAEKKLQKAEDKVKELQGEVDEAEKAEEEAAEKVDELEGKTGGESGGESAGSESGGAIGKAVEEVNKEVKDLDDCKEKLASTKSKLKKAIEEKKEMIEKEEQEKKAVLEKLKAGQAQAVTNQTAEEKIVQTLEKKVEAKNVTFVEAQKKYDKEAAEVKQMEGDLEKAESRLRAVRHKQVDKDGGVYHVEKSPAAASRPSVLLLAALVAALSHGVSAFGA